MLTSLPLDVPEMEHLDMSVLMDVAEMAAGMTEDEIFQTFSMDKAKFSVDERIYFKEFYNYGRGIAINEQIQNLRRHGSGKNGVAASMFFLRRFADEFEGDIDVDSSGNFSFQFGQKPALKSVK